MNLLKALNPWKKKWWRKEEWYRTVNNQNAYKIAGKYDCPAWDIEFYFLHKYKHKESCEERWVIGSRQRMFDTTIFERPEEWIKDKGKSETHYILMDNIEIYDGVDYEE